MLESVRSNQTDVKTSLRSSFLPLCIQPLNMLHSTPHSLPTSGITIPEKYVKYNTFSVIFCVKLNQIEKSAYLIGGFLHWSCMVKLGKWKCCLLEIPAWRSKEWGESLDERPFVDCPFPFWAKQIRSDFQAKEDSSDDSRYLASSAWEAFFLLCMNK